jgi:hypothetical protein
MRNLTARMIAFTATVCCTLPINAQVSEVMQRSSSPSGISIQGDTAVHGQVKNSNSVAVGTENTAKNATGTVRNNVKIHGNTQIDARAQGVNAVAAGKSSRADNAVGTIGGK